MSMPTLDRLAWPLGIALAAGTFLVSGCARELASPPPAVSSSEVKALGRLKPEGGIVSIGAPVGDRIGQIRVKEGDTVAADQELVRLDSYADRLAEKELAETQLAEAKARLLAITAGGEKQIEESRLHLEQVKQLGPLEVAAQEDQVQLLTKRLDNATADLARLTGLRSVPEQELEAQKLAVSAARHQLAQGKLLLEKTGRAHRLDVQAAEAQLETLRATLARAQKEVPVESLVRSLAVATQHWQHTVIHAPAAGRVLAVLAHPGEATGGQPILRLGDTEHMRAVAEVYETQVRRVRPGQKVRITSAALPGPLDGTVERVSSLVGENTDRPLDPAADIDRRVVDVTIRLERSDVAAQFINHQVEVSITVSGDAEVVSVP